LAHQELAVYVSDARPKGSRPTRKTKSPVSSTLSLTQVASLRSAGRRLNILDRPLVVEHARGGDVALLPERGDDDPQPAPDDVPVAVGRAPNGDVGLSIAVIIRRDGYIARHRHVHFSSPRGRHRRMKPATSPPTGRARCRSPITRSGPRRRSAVSGPGMICEFSSV
jgi:hypothetical protein